MYLIKFVSIKLLFKNILIVCVLISLVVSCRVEKRIYRKGFHVVWNHKKVESKRTSGRIQEINNVDQTIELPERQTEEGVALALNSAVEPSFEFKKPLLILRKDTCGDRIFFKNGDIVSAKIVEVDNEKIKYKRCDNLEGPLFTVNKRSLTMVRYYNGTKEDLTVVEEKRVQVKTTEPMGLTGFILAMLGWVFGLTLIIAIPLGIGSLLRYKKEPEKYKNKGLPITALILSIFIAGFWALMFYAIFIALGLVGVSPLNFITIYFSVLALVALVGLIATA